ncbi:MAG: glycerophosphodiester phosphodiesterase [Alphaproteobacteria bacterium]|nr:glycerophosphodiester phosphodiesterase [Alphaproteobacteria bacterium]
MQEWLTRYLYSHRGLFDNSGNAPENSLAAFQASVQNDYGMELDVQAAGDGTPIVFHDYTLDRMTDAQGPVANHDRRTLCRLRLLQSQECIPTLADTLDCVAGCAPLLIEIKSPKGTRIGPLERRIAALLAPYKGLFAVQSFNPESVAWFVENAPAFTRGQIAQNFISRPERGLAWRQRLGWGKLWSCAASQPHFISYNVRDLPGPATRNVRRQRIPLLCWTVRTPQQVAVARRYADSFIFEGFHA